MKGMSMFPLLTVLAAGLAVCAVDAATIVRHPARPPRPADCHVIDVQVLGPRTLQLSVGCGSINTINHDNAHSAPLRFELQTELLL